MYTFEGVKAVLFTEEGSAKFIRSRDRILEILRNSGAIRMQEALDVVDNFGDSWTNMSVLDQMVRLKDIKEVTGSNVCGQYRVFELLNRD